MNAYDTYYNSLTGHTHIYIYTRIYYSNLLHMLCSCEDISSLIVCPGVELQVYQNALVAPESLEEVESIVQAVDIAFSALFTFDVLLRVVVLGKSHLPQSWHIMNHWTKSKSVKIQYLSSLGSFASTFLKNSCFP